MQTDRQTVTCQEIAGVGERRLLVGARVVVPRGRPSCWTEVDSERRATKRALGADDTAEDEDEEEEEEAQTTTAARQRRKAVAAGTGGGERRDAAIGGVGRLLPRGHHRAFAVCGVGRGEEFCVGWIFFLVRIGRIRSSWDG